MATTSPTTHTTPPCGGSRRRTDTADPDATTWFYYDHWSDIEERDGDDALVATYVNGRHRQRTSPWSAARTPGGTCKVPSSATSPRSSTRTASSRMVQVRRIGKASVLTGDGDDATWFTADDSTATSSAIGNPFTFTGRRLDAETGLMYFRYRMYRPEVGTFISRDPLGYTDGMSCYQYAISSPVGGNLIHSVRRCFAVAHLGTPFHIDMKMKSLWFAAWYYGDNSADWAARPLRHNS